MCLLFEPSSWKFHPKEDTNTNEPQALLFASLSKRQWISHCAAEAELLKRTLVLWLRLLNSISRRGGGGGWGGLFFLFSVFLPTVQWFKSKVAWFHPKVTQPKVWNAFPTMVTQYEARRSRSNLTFPFYTLLKLGYVIVNDTLVVWCLFQNCHLVRRCAL